MPSRTAADQSGANALTITEWSVVPWRRLLVLPQAIFVSRMRLRSIGPSAIH